VAARDARGHGAPALVSARGRAPVRVACTGARRRVFFPDRSARVRLAGREADQRGGRCRPAGQHAAANFARTAENARESAPGRSECGGMEFDWKPLSRARDAVAVDCSHRGRPPCAHLSRTPVDRMGGGWSPYSGRWSG